MNHYAIIGTDCDTLLWHGLATSRTSARSAWLADVGYADGAPEHLDIEGTSVARVSARRGDWLKVGQDWVDSTDPQRWAEHCEDTDGPDTN